MKQLGYLLMLVGIAALAAPSIQLRVSATVPPRACEYPDPCDPVSKAIPSRVTVEDDRIIYLGSTPAVRVDGDLMIVTF